MYKPTQNLLEGIKNCFEPQLMPWDEYFMRMAETDFLDGRQNVIGAKSFFIREAPFKGSYTLLGGVTEMLRTVSELRFDREDFQEYLRDMDYDINFINFLKAKRMLNLDIWSGLEGTPFFPKEPIISARGDLISLRLWEGIVTEAVNFASLSLTKWHRLVRTVRPGQVMEFSRRRSQNHKKSTLYGMLAGCSSTSNSEMRRFFNFKIGATFGHEFVQSYGDVKTAFEHWLNKQPRRPIGLIDTLDTMRVDFPAWLEAVYKHREQIKNADPIIWGWRNDSGDLATLPIDQYNGFMKHKLAQDNWFRDQMRIVLTNDLDEYSAQSIIAQIRTQAGAAGFNSEDILRRIIWAAGTKPGTCDGQPSLGGVAKLVEIDGYDCIKLAFDRDGQPGIKTSIPGLNFSSIIRDKDNEVRFLLVHHEPALLDTEIIGVFPENPQRQIKVQRGYSSRRRQALIWDSRVPYHEGANIFSSNTTISDIQKSIMSWVDFLPWEMTRLDMPEPMKVCLTPELQKLRSQMIKQGVLRSDFLK